MPQLLKVQNFTVSADGYGAGEDQNLERPFGHADPGTLLSWVFPTASFPGRTAPGGSRGLDDHLARDFHHNIGAEIMGAHKFSPHRGPWSDHEWQGWWGDEPPFHTPVFVLTHHHRPSFTLADTTFHFVDGPLEDVLDQARTAARGLDVRLGGGAQTIRAFLEADLVDTLHVAVAPLELASRRAGVQQDHDVVVECRVLFTVWGASAGVMQACARGPRRSRLLWWTTLVQVLGALYIGMTTPAAGPAAILLAGLALLATSFFTGGYLWRDSPLVEGHTFLGRAWYAATHERLLRRTQREVDAKRNCPSA